MRALIGQKPMFNQSIKHRKSVFYCFLPHYLYIITQMKKYTVIKHSGHMRTLLKCRKDSPVARVVFVSLVFSNGRCVLSQCNTRFRVLYFFHVSRASSKPIRKFIIWQAPRAGSMQRILCSDWLPEQARWSDTARPGLPVSFPPIKFRQF